MPNRRANAVRIRRGSAEPLGGAPERLAAVQVHLEQAVLRVDEAEGEMRVAGRAGADVRDAPLVPDHGDRALQARQVDGAGQLRRRVLHGQAAATFTFQNIGKLDWIRSTSRLR